MKTSEILVFVFPLLAVTKGHDATGTFSLSLCYVKSHKQSGKGQENKKSMQLGRFSVW